MKIRNELTSDNRLIRTIPIETMEYFDAFACVALVSYEFKWFSKIQFNLHGPEGSLFVEYRENSITAYTRGHFVEGPQLLMVVRLLSSYGNSHTSTVVGMSICDCFNEYLRLSDQRKSFIMKEAEVIMRIETLPDTILTNRNGDLGEVMIGVNFEMS